MLAPSLPLWSLTSVLTRCLPQRAGDLNEQDVEDPVDGSRDYPCDTTSPSAIHPVSELRVHRCVETVDAVRRQEPDDADSGNNESSTDIEGHCPHLRE